MGRSNIILASIVAAVLVLLAVGGAIYVSRGINRGADVTGSSAGRVGDPKPNTAQQMEYSKKSESPSTTGSMINNNVPPPAK